MRSIEIYKNINKGLYCLSNVFVIAYCVTCIYPFQSLNAQNHVPGCMYTTAMMNDFHLEVQAKIKKLHQEGKLDFSKFRPATEDEDVQSDAKMLTAIPLQWPLTHKEYSDFPVWSIGNFYDQDDFSDGDDDAFEDGEREDYNCGERTYDGHQGYDINPEPYHWKAMFDGSVYVVAAASGIIVDKHQGEFDERCDWEDEIPVTKGNYIVIMLEDESTVNYYMHMRDGSLTSKEEGDYVYVGEYLGTVASSGRSTGPHLHFQVNHAYIDFGVGDDDYTGYSQDVFDGECNTLFEYMDAAFESQPPYDDPAVLTLETHSSDPGLYDGTHCDKTISLYYDNSFSGLTTVWFRSKLRDWVDGSTVTHSIYRPSGTLKASYTRDTGSGGRNKIPTDASFSFSALDAAGTYRYTVTFGGKTYSHYFAYSCLSNQTLSGTASGHKGYMVSNSINSTQTISSSSSNYVKYMADSYVQLNEGFEALAGCRFVANLKGCNNSTALMEDEFAYREDDLIENSKLILYPNPSDGIFEMYYFEESDFSAIIQIKDQIGNVIERFNQLSELNELRKTIDITHYAKGVYFVELITKEEILVEPIIIQ